MENNAETIILIANALFLLGAYIVIRRILERDNRLLNKVIAAQDQINRSPFNLDNTLQLIVDRLLQSIPNASGAVIELIDGHELTYRSVAGTLKDHKGYKMNIKNSLSGFCISAGEVIYCHDTETDDRVNKEATRRTSIRSMVVAPLFYEGKIIGVLKVSSAKPKAFKSRDSLTLKLLANMIGPAIAHQQDYESNQKLLDERSHMALHDGLTGLPNRTLFMEVLAGAILRVSRNDKPMALMYLDLDGFKRINDSLGHQAGDMVLIQFSQRLKKVMRETDCIARLSGDEFTIILENLSDPKNDLKIIADKIIAAMAIPFNVAGKKVTLTTSIGGSITTNGKRNLEDLIKAADSHLYKAKNGGKNQYSFEAA